jgi:hypothetical protein
MDRNNREENDFKGKLITRQTHHNNTKYTGGVEEQGKMRSLGT